MPPFICNFQFIITISHVLLNKYKNNNTNIYGIHILKSENLQIINSNSLNKQIFSSRYAIFNNLYSLLYSSLLHILIIASSDFECLYYLCVFLPHIKLNMPTETYTHIFTQSFPIRSISNPLQRYRRMIHLFLHCLAHTDTHAVTTTRVHSTFSFLQKKK